MTAQCRSDGRCQYAIDHDAEGLGSCPDGSCCMSYTSLTDKEIDDLLIQVGASRGIRWDHRDMTLTQIRELVQLAITTSRSKL